MFRTNIQTNDHLTLLKKINSRIYSKIGWFAHWLVISHEMSLAISCQKLLKTILNYNFRENCAKKTEKQMRRYYKRPQVLPSMLEMTKSNWIVVSNNFIGFKFKSVSTHLINN